VSAILIDVPKFVAEIEEHSAGYVAKLRDPVNEELRTAFMKTWTRFHEGDPLYLAPGAVPSPIAPATTASVAGPPRSPRS
jgi:hypothetical protein